MNLLNLITFGGIMHAYIKESVLQLIVLGYLYSEAHNQIQAGRQDNPGDHHQIRKCSGTGDQMTMDKIDEPSQPAS